MDNQDLIKKAQKGNKEAFGKVYDIFGQRIFRFIKLKVQNQQQAEDILQDIFLKAWKALPQFETKDGNFSAWLYKISTNTINDYFRKLYRNPAVLELSERDNLVLKTSLVDEMNNQIDFENIKSIFALLPTQYQQVLELRFIQDFSISDTAKILGRSNLAVRLIQHRALKKTRELIKERYAFFSYSKIQ